MSISVRLDTKLEVGPICQWRKLEEGCALYIWFYFWKMEYQQNLDKMTDTIELSNEALELLLQNKNAYYIRYFISKFFSGRIMKYRIAVDDILLFLKVMRLHARWCVLTIREENTVNCNVANLPLNGASSEWTWKNRRPKEIPENLRP